MIVHVIILATLTAEPTLAEVMQDERTIWYDAQTLPEVMVGRTGLFPVGYNLAGNLDKTGSANNEKPWRHTGGLDDCGPEVSVRRLLWVPPGRKVKVWRISNPRIGDRFAGRFPVGTVSVELLLNRGETFEVRSRRKTDDGWETDQIEMGAKPAGYVAVSNCVDCHTDIGKHSLEIDAARDWYAYVRGLEPGGPIHWHPWDTRGLSYVGLPLRIRDDVKHFVEWES